MSDSTHERFVARQRWHVVRLDGALLGGYSRERDAERCAAVLNRDGERVVAVVVEKGAR